MQKPIKSKNLFCGISLLYVGILFLCDIFNLIMYLVRGAIRNSASYYIYTFFSAVVTTPLVITIILIVIHLVFLILNLVAMAKMNDKSVKTISLVTVIACASLSLLLILINTISYLITLFRFISYGGYIEITSILLQIVVLGFKALFNIAFIVAIVVAVKKAPTLQSNTDTNQNVDNNIDVNKPVIDPIYIDMLTHSLLCLFTLGIYQFVWMYKTTKYLNKVVPSNARNEVLELVLCIFIPFYSVYWYYCTAKSYNVLTKTDSTVLFIILELFGGNVVAPVLIQNKFNEIVQAEFEQEVKEYQKTKANNNQSAKKRPSDYTEIFDINTNDATEIANNSNIISNETLASSIVENETNNTNNIENETITTKLEKNKIEETIKTKANEETENFNCSTPVESTETNIIDAEIITEKAEIIQETIEPNMTSKSLDSIDNNSIPEDSEK